MATLLPAAVLAATGLAACSSDSGIEPAPINEAVLAPAIVTAIRQRAAPYAGLRT
jgi:hypothetical protein